MIPYYTDSSSLVEDFGTYADARDHVLGILDQLLEGLALLRGGIAETESYDEFLCGVVYDAIPQEYLITRSGRIDGAR